MNGHGQRTYVVSGAASGIGKALALLLLGEGASVIALDRDSESLEHLADENGANEGTLLSSALDVSDEAVEAMLSESLDHAFEDVNERVWVEAKLKAEEMLSAVDKALGLAGEKVSVVDREHIEHCATEVRQALESGDRHKLKRANNALDAATQQPLRDHHALPPRDTQGGL